jgi:hypothetical protein
MTDPDAPADGQPGSTGPALPRPAGNPETERAPDLPPGPADASGQPAFEEAPPRGFTPPAEDSRPEDAGACEADETDGLARYLDDIADELAQLREMRDELVQLQDMRDELLATVMPTIKMANYTLPAVQAISKMAALPDLGLFKAGLPGLSLAASLPALGIGRHAFSAVGDLSFLQNITTMASSWDHGLFGIAGRQFIENAAALNAAALVIAPHQELLRSMAGLAASRAAAFRPLTDFAAMNATAGLVGLFRSWRETAETGLGLLRRLARAAHRAALLARDAVLDGDDEPVAWFIEDWLGMRVTPQRIEAVGAALLEEGWDAGVPEDPDYLITDLRRRTRRQARVLKPIWETRLNFRAVGQLDHAAAAGNGTPLTVADLLPDPHTTEDLALASEYEQQRLALVLSRLKPDELQVTTVYARRGDLTWAEAARLAGASDAMGERVRRKLKRLGAEHRRRLVQAGGA